MYRSFTLMYSEINQNNKYVQDYYKHRHMKYNNDCLFKTVFFIVSKINTKNYDTLIKSPIFYE